MKLTAQVNDFMPNFKRQQKIDTGKYAHKIYQNLAPRLDELVEKVRKGTYNPAYQYVFEINILYIIHEELKKLVRRMK